MPSYTYHCDFCNVDETIECKMSEYRSVEDCLVCHKPMNRKVEDILPQNYIINCSGFYGKKS